MRNQELVGGVLFGICMKNKLGSSRNTTTNAAFLWNENRNVEPEQVLSETDAGVKSRRRKNKESVRRGKKWGRRGVGGVSYTLQAVSS